jgi:ParB-like chromosome segregation protein Spo0J
VRFLPARPKRPLAQQPEKKEPSAVRYLALAREMKALMEAEGINQAEIARRYALTRARVCQLMVLLKLPPDVLAGIDVLAGRRLGARYLSERRVRRTRAVAPLPAVSGS